MGGERKVEMKQDKQENREKPAKSGNWFARHKVLTGIIVFVLLIAIGQSMGGNEDAKVVDNNSNNDSSKTEDTKAPEKTEFNVGEVISFDDKEVTVSDVVRNWNSGNQFITPDSGNEYVKVGVTIKNNSNSEISYNTFDWKLKDSSGDIKSVATVAFGVDGALNSGELAEGGNKSGFIVFEVPSGDDGLVLRYEPSFWSNKKLEIKL